MRRRFLVPLVAVLATAAVIPPASARNTSSLSFACQINVKAYPSSFDKEKCVGLASGAGVATDGVTHAAWVADNASFQLKLTDYTEGGCGIGNGDGLVKISPVTVVDSNGNVDAYGQIEMPMVFLHLFAYAEVRAGSKNGPPPFTLTWNTPAGPQVITDTFGYDGRGAWVPDALRWIERGCPTDHTPAGPMTIRLAITMASQA